MKNLFCIVPLMAAVVSPISSVVAAPSKAARGSLLDYYDRLPSKHFLAFGGVNRRSLLKRKGAIVDYQHKFIEIPGSDDAADGDLEKLQISLFPNGNEPWVVISRIVWPQSRTPSTLNFYYGYSDDGGLRSAASSFFPGKVGKNYQGDMYLNAYLPRQGLTIQIVDGEVHSVPQNFTYRIPKKVGQPFFVRVK